MDSDTSHRTAKTANNSAVSIGDSECDNGIVQTFKVFEEGKLVEDKVGIAISTENGENKACAVVDEDAFEEITSLENGEENAAFSENYSLVEHM